MPLGGRHVAGIYIPPPIKPHCSTESKGPRLMITKIVCEDFKSYANTVTLGPFHHVSLLFPVIDFLKNYIIFALF